MALAWEGATVWYFDVISSVGDFSVFISTQHAERCQNARSWIPLFPLFCGGSHRWAQLPSSRTKHTAAGSSPILRCIRYWVVRELSQNMHRLLNGWTSNYFFWTPFIWSYQLLSISFHIKIPWIATAKHIWMTRRVSKFPTLESPDNSFAVVPFLCSACCLSFDSWLPLVCSQRIHCLSGSHGPHNRGDGQNYPRKSNSPRSHGTRRADSYTSYHKQSFTVCGSSNI